MRPTLEISKIISLISICTLFASGENAKKSTKSVEIHVEHKPSECVEESAVGDKVEIHYTGTLENGQVFDSSIQKKRDPISLTLGAGQVIEGWEEGLLGMCVGEKRRLVIPPHMGYGTSGYPPVIPGGATLLFEVNLVGLEKKSGGSLPLLSIARFLMAPTILGFVIYFMYSRYRKEVDAKKGAKKKSHKRR